MASRKRLKFLAGPSEESCMSKIDTAIADYLSKLNACIEQSELENIHFEADPRGRKFTRIVRVITGSTGQVVSRGAHSFVERETGLIWKPDGWKGPALNFARGSVYDLPERVHDSAQYGF